VLILPFVTLFIPYAAWPFLNEVILLERNPLFGRRGRMSTFKRNSLLHHGKSGVFTASALGAAFLSSILITALWLTQKVLLDWLFGYQVDGVGWLIIMQAAFWLVAGYFTVARFLGYLDQRIRIEGWEVELSFRAQRERLTRQIA